MKNYLLIGIAVFVLLGVLHEKPLRAAEWSTIEVPKSDQSKDKIPVHYRLEESKRGRQKPTLLLLQGGPLEYAFWGNKFRQYFLGEFNVLTVEYRGVGRSVIPEAPRSSEVFNSWQIVQDVELIRQQVLGDQPVHILAISWGTTLAVKYASLYSQNVGKMVLVNGAKDGQWAVDQLISNLDLNIDQVLEEAVWGKPSGDKFLQLYAALREKTQNGEYLIGPSGNERPIDWEVMRRLYVGYSPQHALDLANSLENRLGVLERILKREEKLVERITFLAEEDEKYTFVNDIFCCKEFAPQVFDSEGLSDTEKSNIYERLQKKYCKHNTAGAEKYRPLALNNILNESLVISAEEDKIIGKKYVEQLAEQLPHSVLWSLPGLTHKEVLRTKNTEILNAILRYLADGERPHSAEN